MDETMKFEFSETKKTKEIIDSVYRALEEKGYNPIAQISGYLLSGDPAYITSWGNARTMICKLDRDEILQEMVKCYLNAE